MPKYRVELTDGRKFEVEADQPPSADDVLGALSRQSRPSETPPRSLRDRATDVLPTVGGIVGMAAKRTPAGIAAAGLGGMIGESARQVVQGIRGKHADVPATVGGQLKAIGQAGLEQAGIEGVGRGIVRGIRAIGKGLSTFAVRPPPGLQEEFPGVMDTIIKERLAVRGARGSPRATQLRQASAAETGRLLAGSQQTFDPMALARGVSGLEADIAKEAVSRPKLREVARLKEQFLKERVSPGTTVPRELSATELKELKQAEQAMASPVLRAQRKGQPIQAREGLRARFGDALAKEARQQLETIPGVGTSEARTQRLIGAERAVKGAERRRLPLAAELATPIVGATIGGTAGGDLKGVGTGAASALALRGALSPRVMSRTGLALTSRTSDAMLQQLPRLIRELMRQQEMR